MSTLNKAALFSVFSCVVGLAILTHPTSGDDCPGGWLTGPCYTAVYRTCRDCLAEVHSTANLQEGDCGEFGCEITGTLPGGGFDYDCPATGGVDYTEGGLNVPCHCEDGVGFDNYELEMDEEGNVVAEVCALIQPCNPDNCVEDDNFNRVCWRPANQQPTEHTCSRYILIGDTCDCGA